MTNNNLYMNSNANLALYRDLKYTKYDCAPHNDNLLDSIFPNTLVKEFQTISMEVSISKNFKVIFENFQVTKFFAGIIIRE